MDFEFFSLTKKTKELLVLIEVEREPNISQNRLAENISVTVGQVNNYIKDLTKKGLIQKIDVDNKKKKYVITKKGLSAKWKLLDGFFSERKKLANFMSGQAVEEIINIATIDALGSVILDLAKYLGYFPKNVKIDKFISGRDIFSKMKNHYHFALVGAVPAFLKISAGAPFDIVAKITSGGHLLIAKSKFNSIKQLEQSNIYIPTKFSVTENLLSYILEEMGELDIAIKEDKSLIESIKSKKSNHDFDAVLIWEPYASIFLENNKGYKVLYDFNKTIAGTKYISNVLLQNNHLLSNSRRVEEDIVNAIQKTISYYNLHKTELTHVISNMYGIDHQLIINGLSRIQFMFSTDLF